MKKMVGLWSLLPLIFASQLEVSPALPPLPSQDAASPQAPKPCSPTQAGASETLRQNVPLLSSS